VENPLAMGIAVLANQCSILLSCGKSPLCDNLPTLYAPGFNIERKSDMSYTLFSAN
jgi:hypothetical protein